MTDVVRDVLIVQRWAQAMMQQYFWSQIALAALLRWCDVYVRFDDWTGFDPRRCQL